MSKRSTSSSTYLQALYHPEVKKLLIFRTFALVDWMFGRVKPTRQQVAHVMNYVREAFRDEMARWDQRYGETPYTDLIEKSKAGNNAALHDLIAWDEHWLYVDWVISRVLNRDPFRASSDQEQRVAKQIEQGNLEEIPQSRNDLIEGLLSHPSIRRRRLTLDALKKQFDDEHDTLRRLDRRYRPKEPASLGYGVRGWQNLSLRSQAKVFQELLAEAKWMISEQVDVLPWRPGRLPTRIRPKTRGTRALRNFSDQQVLKHKLRGGKPGDRFFKQLEEDIRYKVETKSPLALTKGYLRKTLRRRKPRR